MHLRLTSLALTYGCTNISFYNSLTLILQIKIVIFHNRTPHVIKWYILKQHVIDINNFITRNNLIKYTHLNILTNVQEITNCNIKFKTATHGIVRTSPFKFAEGNDKRKVQNINCIHYKLSA